MRKINSIRSRRQVHGFEITQVHWAEQTGWIRLTDEFPLLASRKAMAESCVHLRIVDGAITEHLIDQQIRDLDSKMVPAAAKRL